jgi:hypothetical protein
MWDRFVRHESAGLNEPCMILSYGLGMLRSLKHPEAVQLQFKALERGGSEYGGAISSSHQIS